MDINKITLIGRLGKKPVLLATPSGKQVCNFPLATSYKEATQWHNVTAWGKTAEVVAQYADKGSRLYAEGRLEYRKYEKDGQTRYITDIIASQIILLDKAQGRPKQQGLAEPAPEDEDLPF